MSQEETYGDKTEDVSFCGSAKMASTEWAVVPNWGSTSSFLHKQKSNNLKIKFLIKLVNFPLA